jgi:phage tail sheath protein FI
MATFSRPGVYIQEVALPQTVTPADFSSAVGAFAGSLPKGPTTAPVYLAAWSDFVNTFGGLNDSYPTTWAAYNFFANGGRGLYVKRVVGTGSAAGTLPITDGTGTTLTATVTAASAASGTVTYTANNTFTAGQTVSITGLSTSAFNLTNVVIATRSATQFTVTNAATGTAVTGATATATVTTISATVFTLNAINAGSWSSSYQAQIVSAGTSTRFGLNIYQVVTVNGVTSNVLVESYTDLSMDSTDKNYFRSIINTASALITVPATGIDSTKFPGTMPSAVAFSGGTNGATVGRTDYSAAWPTFDSVNNPLVMYAPDASYNSDYTISSSIHGDAVIYAAGRNDAFVVIDTVAGNLTAVAAQTEVDGTVANFAASTAGGIAAAYWPWINIPDPTKSAGATRLQAPGAAVVGQYLATDASRSPAKTPAGLNNKIALAVSTEHLFTNAELDAINTSSNPINPIRNVPGAGIVIMGGRTLDNTPNNRYINIRRSLIYIEKRLSDLTQFAVFENNDSRLWLQIRTTINSFLLSYWQNGGLRGSTANQAFYVKCDATTTSFTDMQNGRVNIEVGVALEYPAEFVVIKLGQLTGNATA